MINKHLAKLTVVVCIVLVGCAQSIKEPAVAGSFYPSDAQELKQMIDGFLANAPYSPVDGRLMALISPHAGYRYSGQIAAYGYNHLRERKIGTVVIIGASHHMSYNGASVYAKGAMKTPLGIVEVDEEKAAALLNSDANVFFDPKPYEKEHSIEVQIPFLQETLKNFKIVPILVGNYTKETFVHLTGKLAEILGRDDGVIIVASTDLSHYHDYRTAVDLDKTAIDAVKKLSIEELQASLSTGECEMCGSYPVMITMSAARELGATEGVLFKYANSGDVTGDKLRVVGYSSIGLYRTHLTQTEKELLLSLAKRTVIDYVTYGKTPEIEIRDPKLTSNGATFVTINKKGALRGCIGNIFPNMPLYRSVITNAVSASTKDPRFQPMTKSELTDMEVEVSILSPFEPLKDIRDIVLGKHGLYLVKGNYRSVFLPQVPVEQGWNLDTYLEKLAQKAGLPKDGWKDAELYVFTAEVVK